MRLPFQDSTPYYTRAAAKLAVFVSLLISFMGKSQIYVEGDAQIFLGDSSVISVVKDQPASPILRGFLRIKPAAKLKLPPSASDRRVARTEKKSPAPAAKIHFVPVDDSSVFTSAGSASHAAVLPGGNHTNFFAATLITCCILNLLARLSRIPCAGYTLRTLLSNFRRTPSVRPPPAA